MFENLNAVLNRFDQIAVELTRPEVVCDREKFSRLMKEHSETAPLAETYRQYLSAVEAGRQARMLAEDAAGDSELRELAQEEVKSAKAEELRLTEEIKLLLLPKDPNDAKNVIVEIRAGAGGEEAALFAAVLFRMYAMYAEAHRFHLEITAVNETELGGYKEICFMIEGAGAFSRLKYESGVHRVQRVPDTEAGGRIHTSTATVAVMPEADEVEIDINPADLKIDTFRSSGAGGQYINKTSSAIRITHLPTGTVVECQDERSQYKNKDKALRVLRARLFDAAKSAHDDAIASDRRMKVGTGDRSERIRTYNYPQGRLTDHRIGLTLYKLESVLNGDLDEIIDALITFERTEALKQQENF